MQSTIDFRLRHIPWTLHKELKIRAATEGVSMEQLMLDILSKSMTEWENVWEKVGRPE